MGIYFTRNGERVGPVERSEFDRQVESGGIGPDTLVWEDGMAEWEPFREYQRKHGAGGGSGQQACVVCNKFFSKDDMLVFRGQFVCGGCKATYVQGLKEGVDVEGTSAWRDGKRLVIRRGGELPDCCVKCGAPVSGNRLRKALYYVPPWIWLILLINWIVLVIVYYIIRKRVNVQIGLCERHRSRRFYSITAGWVMSLGSIVGLCVIAAANYDAPWLIIASVVIFLAGLIVGSVGGHLVRPSKLNENYVWFSGVGKGCLENLTDWQGYA